MPDDRDPPRESVEPTLNPVGSQTMKHAKRTLFSALIVCVAAGLYFASEMSVSGSQVCEIRLDMTRPTTIEYPFEVVEIGEHGERGLNIGAHMGRGWKGEAGGAATYEFYAPLEGQYVLWIHCLWHDECTNAIYGQIDGADRMILGNDPVFDRWHWARGFSVGLKKGPHVLTLSNHSDNVAVREVLLTTAGDAAPLDAKDAITDLFYDNFNGCDHGNFVLWKAHSGSWSVERRENRLTGDNAVVGKSSDQGLLTLTQWEWRDIALVVSARSPAETNAGGWSGVCFGVRNDSEYHLLRWQERRSEDVAQMEVVRTGPGGVEVLASYEVPWQSGKWHEVRLDIDSGGVRVTIDAGIHLEIPMNETIEGGIGLWLLGDIETHFDEVHVRKHGIESM